MGLVLSFLLSAHVEKRALLMTQYKNNLGSLIFATLIANGFTALVIFFALPLMPGDSLGNLIVLVGAIALCYYGHTPIFKTFAKVGKHSIEDAAGVSAFLTLFVAPFGIALHAL